MRDRTPRTALLMGCGGDGSRLAAPQTLHGDAPAPDFALRNANGRVVRLSQFRGRVVLLTFVYSDCPDVCPLIVEKLKAAQKQLGRRVHRMQIVAVSVDPRGDTPRAVRAFLRAHRMTGRMEYLLGSRRELARVWQRYGEQMRSRRHEACLETSRFRTMVHPSSP